MNRITISCIAVCLGIVSAGAVSSSYFDINTRIVDGQNAFPGQFPYAVSLRRVEIRHFCGGSIIRLRYVLTAAHCTNPFEPHEITVIAGTHDLSSGGVHHRISRIINHPEYIADLVENDIGLLEMEIPFQYNALVQPIRLGSEYIGTVAAVVSGWGRLWAWTGELPTYLQTMHTETITNEDCRDRHDDFYSAHVYDNTICSLNRPGQGICQGDSGSALVVGNFAVGVASWVIPCATELPDVYARVSSHHSWILGVVGDVEE